MSANSRKLLQNSKKGHKNYLRGYSSTSSQKVKSDETFSSDDSDFSMSVDEGVRLIARETLTNTQRKPESDSEGLKMLPSKSQPAYVGMSAPRVGNIMSSNKVGMGMNYSSLKPMAMPQPQGTLTRVSPFNVTGSGSGIINIQNNPPGAKLINVLASSPTGTDKNTNILTGKQLAPIEIFDPDD